MLETKVFTQGLDQYLELINYNDWGWDNFIGSSEKIKRAHVEHYKKDMLEVLHVVITPALHLKAPVFGLDIISIKGNISFICCDLSPVAGFTWEHNLDFGNKDAPEWGNFFSKDAIFWKPQRKVKENVEIYLSQVEKLFENYLVDLDLTRFSQVPEKALLDVNYYSDQQRKNKKTFAALSANIGKDKAREFIDTVLFPTFELNEDEKFYQGVLDRKTELRNKTLKEHKDAEKSELSDRLVNGNVTETEWAKYLQFYLKAFIVLEEDLPDDALRFTPLFEKDLANHKEQPDSSVVGEYLDYLESLTKEEKESHRYVLSLGHLYGGKWIAKALPEKMSKLHLTETTEEMIYDVRLNSRHATVKENAIAFRWVQKAYDDISKFNV